jgi:hypothetical protein
VGNGDDRSDPRRARPRSPVDLVRRRHCAALPRRRCAAADRRSPARPRRVGGSRRRRGRPDRAFRCTLS